MIKRLFGDKRGQSFIEAMIAITIIVTSISSSLSLVQSSVTASRSGGTHVVAANLAREGIEVVRSLRDTNWLLSQSFQVGLTDATDKAAIPVLSPSTGEWSLTFGNFVIDGAEAVVWQSTADGTLLQDSSQPAGTAVSPYSRLLRLDYVCRDNSTGVESVVTSGTCPASSTLVGLLATSTVKWVAVTKTKTQLVVEERLYDWR